MNVSGECKSGLPHSSGSFLYILITSEHIEFSSLLLGDKYNNNGDVNVMSSVSFAAVCSESQRGLVLRFTDGRLQRKTAKHTDTHLGDELQCVVHCGRTRKMARSRACGPTAHAGAQTRHCVSAGGTFVLWKCRSDKTAAISVCVVYRIILTLRLLSSLQCLSTRCKSKHNR